MQAANYDRRGSPSGARMGFEASEGVRNSRLFGCWGQAGWLAGCQSDRGSTSCWRGGWIWATEAISPFTVFPTGGGDGQDSIRPIQVVVHSIYPASLPVDLLDRLAGKGLAFPAMSVCPSVQNPGHLLVEVPIFESLDFRVKAAVRRKAVCYSNCTSLWISIVYATRCSVLRHMFATSYILH